MPDPEFKSLDRPDETIEFPGAAAHLVELGDLTIAHLITQPGWRWSTNHRPVIGGDWCCQARHVGVGSPAWRYIPAHAGSERSALQNRV